MKPLIVLVITFIASIFIIRIFGGNYDFAMAGRIAMSVMLVFTAIGHFAFKEGMVMMIPKQVPFKSEIVLLSGIVEIAGAIGLLVSGLSTLTAWLLIAFFMLILPANIYAAINKIDYQKATFNGKGLAYLWFRIPLQLLFIIWVYLSAINV